MSRALSGRPIVLTVCLLGGAVWQGPNAAQGSAATSDSQDRPDAKLALRLTDARTLAQSGGRKPAAPPTSPSASSEAQTALRGKVRLVLDFYHGRPLNTRENNCWELMHSIVSYGVTSEVRRGGPQGPAINTIAWLCSGAACNGQSLLSVEQGRVTAAKGPRVQGHHGQFLAILAQSKVKADYPIYIGKRSFTLDDLMETEKLSCYSNTELTFKLISCAHYLDSDATWKNGKGENWSISRLIREEIASPVNGAPCGGTHRLMGLSYAVHERIKQERSVDGEFLRAQTYVNDFHRYAFRLQNADGSFSTEWFKGRGAKADLERRLQTSGHILEWLAYSVGDEMLDDPRLIKAVSYLAGILDRDRSRNWSIGPLGHGLHALAIYEERTQQRDEIAPSARVARQESLRRDDAMNPSSGPALERRQPVLVPAAAPRRAAPALDLPRADVEGENRDR